MKRLRATVVVDNIGNDALKGEWGLCVYIEYGEDKILLDTGSSGLFIENGKKLGIPLEDIGYAVLSHAHYDHANGMRPFFRLNKKAKFYLRDACAENCYGKRWIFKKYIGLPKGILQDYKDRIEYASGDKRIAEGVFLIPHKSKGLAVIGKRENLYIKEKDGSLSPDDFAHEQSLVFDTPEGLVIFNSCSHGGADRIINEAIAAFPDKKVLALIGGFHLFRRTEDEVRSFSKKIKETGIPYIYTGHCTGKRAYGILKEELGDVARQLKVGLVMEF